MRKYKGILQTTALLVTLSFTGFKPAAQIFVQPTVTDESWSRAYKPFRIAGNLYYVGTDELACYLITTPQGHILINTGLAESVPMIKANVSALGFKMSDIRILLTTQAHYDHVGGMAEIKRITGATMMVDEKDAPVLADGGNSDYVIGGKGSIFAPVKTDRLLHDHDTIRLGGMQIIVLHHPGHTKGSCSYLFDVKDDNRSYRMLIANMPSLLDATNLHGMPTYPDVGKDYAYTLNAMKHLQFDLWVSSHASQFGLHQKRSQDDGYRPEAFADRRGYDSSLNVLQQAYLKRLDRK